MPIALVCGSLDTGSANRAALDVARDALLAAGHEVVVVDNLDTIPPFRPDRVDDPGVQVETFKATLERSDAMMLAAPEYAAGPPGVVKNALDWLVGSGSLYHRPAAVVSAGTTGGEHTIPALVHTLSWQGALVVATLGIGAPRTKTDTNGTFVHGPTITAIHEATGRLLAAVNAAPRDLLAMVSETVGRFGIDATRFGLG